MTRTMTQTPSPLVVEFCGEEHVVAPDQRFTVGRDADLVVDEDNAYLHRRMVEFAHADGFWWIANVGSRIAVTLSGEAGTLQSWLGPGIRIPVVLPVSTVLFSAGGVTYEIEIRNPAAAYEPVGAAEPGVRDAPGPDDLTLGAVPLTPSQFRLILALAEHTLRRAGTGLSDLPSNAAAAERLGWTATTFNRKLDNVCEKYANAGVKGLRGDPRKLATNRRARLVEYAVAARIVRPEHLPLLDQPEVSDRA